MEFKKTEDLVALLVKSIGKEHKEKYEQFAAYCMRLKLEKDRGGAIKNKWMQSKEVEALEGLFRRVHNEGLVFDGVHVTLTSRGISYDYQAYKNKMLIVYPDTYIDLQLVYEGDEFEFSKNTGKVHYRHEIKNPFDTSDERIIGGYCVIKNKRGEFLTTLDKAAIQKHRAVAKTDSIWKQWFPEMCLKTIMRKACKYHFDDKFEGMDEVDNEQYDLEQAGKSRLEILNKQIVDLLDTYQGEDIEDIRLQCKQARDKKTFNEDFAEGIVTRLGGEI